MGIVVSSASTSLDGFVAYPNNDPGPLFDWYEAGDVEIVNAGDLPPFHLTRESADYWTGWVERDRLPRGRPAALRHHRRLEGRASDGRAVRRAHPRGADGLGVRRDRQRALRHRRASRPRSRAPRRSPATSPSASRPAPIAGQALAAGLLDEVAIDLVPVVLGEGHPYFADVAPEAVRLGDPTVVIPSTRVTHLRFPVLK